MPRFFAIDYRAVLGIPVESCLSISAVDTFVPTSQFIGIPSILFYTPLFESFVQQRMIGFVASMEQSTLR